MNPCQGPLGTRLSAQLMRCCAHLSHCRPIHADTNLHLRLQFLQHSLCLECHTDKLVDGLLSADALTHGAQQWPLSIGAADVPVFQEGVQPATFKALVGRGHAFTAERRVTVSWKRLMVCVVYSHASRRSPTRSSSTLKSSSW